MLRCAEFGDTIYIFDSEKVTTTQARQELHRMFPNDGFINEGEHPEDKLFEEFGNGLSGVVQLVRGST